MEISFHFVEHTRNKTVDTAIDTMRKYQYIQEIYKSWRTGDYKGSTECMEEIGEVLKDGDVD